MDWNSPDNQQPYNYMLYRKQEGGSTFQTVPAKATANVLNIYPPVSLSISFTNWKGQSFTLPKSASLKMWMETPNAENPRGYGKGLINVDAVSIPDFNKNPDAYLKNPDGTYKYDAVFEGAWDGNGFQPEDDYSPQAVASLKKWIADGRGYLAGHDTIMYQTVWNTHTDELRQWLNIKVVGLDSAVPNNIPTAGDYSGNVTVRVKNKGLLTNYPWNIGDVGTILTVPASHTTSQISYGDVWMDYTNFNGSSTDIYGQGNGNYYLSTWNNTAMIQTGHSTGNATPDEQKVLANTLFYLSQITNQTSWDEHSGQDFNAPNAPTITNVVPNSKTSQISVDYSSASDNGTTYQYYVQAIGMNNNARINSNIQTSTITSGIKGYSIMVDNNPNTIPDGIIETTSTHYVLNQNINCRDFYVHVAAIDNAGNMSSIAHYHYVDNTPPNLSVVASTTNWINGNATLTATASDSESGLYGIQLPDGNWIQNGSVSYTVSANGTYTFQARDNAGNITTKSITVSNIDTTAPGSPVITTNSSWINASSVPVSITSGVDGQSGVNKTEYKLEGATNQGYISYSQPFSISNERVTKITARSIDNVGNVSSESVSYVRIDRSVPMNTSITIQLK
ncbi:hypothetical protein PP175_26955 (plasmid) [Aneurinibacillus sp. Ricciae_BoGa-3]|uniref:OmpL47-type beta-barrel domain-containing protein n=1 Tax=Aneurinibacillus sp. Ricciae_BoGa-3 TaxID=3022697 RepID=UPI00234100F8|nr:hypothetical protein [Aneurinibacillus sp. Ricciae_BoGa-3]WCK57678.1 hypothetical protein PP175_26955 [Aneurinibacillus sp. Ricciae_BoGa-3]